MAADPKKEIDYRLRPAKHIERKMICEALHQLSHFGRVKSYRYIGFGARYFVDFILFHRSIGIDKMISIEKDTYHLDRYKWNKPFRCIQVEPGSSTEVLPKLAWNKKTILWLDYDGALNSDGLSDIAFFIGSSPAGSVLLVTANAHVDLSREADIRALRERIDIPASYADADLAGYGAARALREVIANKIQETVNARNGGLGAEEKLTFTQLFHFHYMDSVRMLTVGGILWDETQRSAMEAKPFEHLTFIREGHDAFEIEIPALTLREIRYLDTHLPIGGSKLPRITPIPDSERDKYKQVYRYFPAFTEADL